MLEIYQEVKWVSMKIIMNRNILRYAEGPVVKDLKKYAKKAKMSLRVTLTVKVKRLLGIYQKF